MQAHSLESVPTAMSFYLNNITAMIVLLNILKVYSIRTRSRAADIFNTCASLIYAMEENNKVRSLLTGNNYFLCSFVTL